MELNQYLELAPNTLAPLDSELTNNLHMTLGMVTEVGELADIYKKNLAYGKSVDNVNAQEELGDLMWYIACYCKINKFDLNKIMATNIAKLKSRYPEKFDAEKALNRNLDEERKILENGSI